MTEAARAHACGVVLMALGVFATATLQLVVSVVGSGSALGFALCGLAGRRA